MKLGELIKLFRVQVKDEADPVFWEKETLIDWLNEAIDEAAIRGRLLFDMNTPEVCNIAVTANNAQYQLHPALYELDRVAFVVPDSLEPIEIKLCSTTELDHIMPNWRTEKGVPQYAFQSDTAIRLAPVPNVVGTLKLEGYRTQIKPIDEYKEPEIHRSHHIKLLDWLYYKAFSVTDAETFDRARSEAGFIAFEDYFGVRPDSNLRRATRVDYEHSVKPFWV